MMRFLHDRHRRRFSSEGRVDDEEDDEGVKMDVSPPPRSSSIISSQCAPPPFATMVVESLRNCTRREIDVPSRDIVASEHGSSVRRWRDDGIGNVAERRSVLSRPPSFRDTSPDRYNFTCRYDIVLDDDDISHSVASSSDDDDDDVPLTVKWRSSIEYGTSPPPPPVESSFVFVTIIALAIVERGNSTMR
jgi:hypothetical protein